MPLSFRAATRPCLLAVLGIALSTPALACPTALGKGLSLRYASGASSQITPGPVAGQVVVRARYAGSVEEGDVITSWHGIYDIRYVEYGPDAGADPYSENLSYPDGPPPVPVPGLIKFEVNAVLETPAAPEAEVNSITSGELGPVTVGGCAFEGFSLTSTVYGADEAITDGVTWNFIFIPALGLGIQQGDGDMDEVVALEALQ